jgi:hypothetical protein
MSKVPPTHGDSRLQGGCPDSQHLASATLVGKAAGAEEMQLATTFSWLT